MKLWSTARHGGPWRPRIPSVTTIAIVALLVIACGMVGLIFVVAASRTTERDSAAGTAVDLAQQVDAACASATTRADLGDLCGTAQGIVDDPDTVTSTEPIPGPQGDAGEKGATGEPGPSPTPEQVAAAVAAYCAEGRCARSPSDAQVSAAVVAYCATGACTGPAGSNGQDGGPGVAGAPGTAGATGEPGPGPTAAQIATAVAEYCTANGCEGETGPAGPAGEPGATGPAGRGIAALACSSTPLTGTTSITVTFDDGTTQTVECS